MTRNKRKVFEAFWHDNVGHADWLQVKDFINKTLASREDLAYMKSARCATKNGLHGAL
jgi:hypothetical protein